MVKVQDLLIRQLQDLSTVSSLSVGKLVGLDWWFGIRSLGLPQIVQSLYKGIPGIQTPQFSISWFCGAKQKITQSPPKKNNDIALQTGRINPKGKDRCFNHQFCQGFSCAISFQGDYSSVFQTKMHDFFLVGVHFETANLQKKHKYGFKPPSKQNKERMSEFFFQPSTRQWIRLLSCQFTWTNSICRYSWSHINSKITSFIHLHCLKKEMLDAGKLT